MKKFYSLVLMAAALLVSTTASATTVAKIGATEYETFEAAWKAAQNNDEILLTAKKVEIGTTLWLGTTTMADMDPLSITLNLNGDTLMSTAQKMFVLTHGSLTVKNGVIQHAPTGSLMSGSEYNSAIEVFRVFGSTYKDVDSKEAAVENLYSHLTIEASAKIIAAVNGITVDNNNGTAFTVWAAGADGGMTPPTWADLTTNVYASSTGVAHGVRIDVKGYIEARKYAIKANGNLGAPNQLKSGYPLSTHKQDREGTQYAVLAGDAKNFSPYIHVYSGAKLLTTEFNRTDAVAAYSSGYARWLVEGTVEGSTAVYVKSGELDVKNAIITSNFTGTRSESTEDRGSGVDAGGSGIAIESSANYAGGTSVTIEGSTVITPTKGLALDEKITNAADTSKVESVEIKGGTFKEGDAGTIKVTTETTTGSGKTESTSVTIDGGTFEFADNTQGTNTGVDLGGKTLEEFLVAQATTSETTHTVVVETDEFGHQTIVISDGNPPVVANSVIGAAENAAINWQNTGTTEETLVADLKLAELQISQDYAQKLIIPDGKKLEVGRVVLGAKAQIVVEAGGKLIVTGKQGLAAFQESNLILKNENGKRSIFLFHPDVTSNTHPMATFELVSTSWRESATNAQSEVIGIPTYTAITNIACKDAGRYGYLQVYGQNGTWENIGFTDDNPFPYEKVNKPFAPYALTAYRKLSLSEDPLTFEFSGELYGNSDASLNANLKWSFFANSYTAELDLATFLAGLAANAQNVTPYVYVSTVMPNGHWRWDAISSSILGDEGVATKLNPMQGFLLNNKGNEAEVNDINYKTMVYAPAVPGYVPAPRRGATVDYSAKLYVVVTSEDGSYDNVKFRETEEAKACEKFMNDDVNIYATSDEKNAIVAAEDLNDTYVGFSTVKGGEFTISFANVDGREFDIIDLENGARINVAEGSEYTFLTPANYTNDYRFKIVERADVATDIENTEAVKSAKGIYTITGQYMGEMNVWNSLPAGVYVVNGEKRIK